jgi:hypothetical protein
MADIHNNAAMLLPKPAPPNAAKAASTIIRMPKRATT